MRNFILIYLEASTRSIPETHWALEVRLAGSLRLPCVPGPAVSELIQRRDVQDQEVAEVRLETAQTEAAAGEHASAPRRQDHLRAQAVEAAPDRLVLQRHRDAADTITAASQRLGPIIVSQHSLCCALHRCTPRLI